MLSCSFSRHGYHLPASTNQEEADAKLAAAPAVGPASTSGNCPGSRCHCLDTWGGLHQLT
jgi:hypothetical protein